MAMYQGDVVAIRVDATDPFSGAVLGSGYTATADVYVAGVNGKTDPAARTDPTKILVAALPFVYDSVSQAWYAYVDTDGPEWVQPETTTYSYRVTFTGTPYRNSEFGTFKLAP